MSLFCNNCGRENRDRIDFCSECGATLQQFSHEKSITAIYQSKITVNTTGAELILIPCGTFQMGSEKYDDEKPIHIIEVKSFYMSKYPVTNKEYCIYKKGHKNPGNNFPVVRINWYEVIDYCNWLSDRERLPRCYVGKSDNIVLNISKNGYRLPTEAEWEYACRAGSPTNYYWGNEMNGDYCWYDENSGGMYHPVGQKKPNKFGLYDMSGNVFEWCSDWYDKNYYSISLSDDPIGPERGVGRVIRGGSYYGGTDYWRSSGRNYSNPNNYYDVIGFRLVRSAPEKSK
ncbi:zinc-ribbon domain-containing protein [Candidatus Parcubacteria bacterium]|nr:MAG: zinc-ribbon domain-containing protein [Candidatus Parcubacteria bacterium]